MSRPNKRLDEADRAKGPQIAVLLATERALRKRLKEETNPQKVDALVKSAVRLIEALIKASGGKTERQAKRPAAPGPEAAPDPLPVDDSPLAFADYEERAK